MERCWIFLLITVLSCSVLAEPLGTAITYQGELRQSGQPAKGSFDFEFYRKPNFFAFIR